MQTFLFLESVMGKKLMDGPLGYRYLSFEKHADGSPITNAPPGSRCPHQGRSSKDETSSSNKKGNITNILPTKGDLKLKPTILSLAMPSPFVL
jgi:hypothetical protein